MYTFLLRQVQYRLLVLISTVVFAISTTFGSLAVAQSLPNQMDIRVLIDVSGSMKKTDPKTLRIPALQVLTQLLPHGSKAGVWQFANHPEAIVPLGLVDPQWQKQATAAAQSISSKGQFTDIGAALKAAAFSQQDQASGRQLHLILLTDGMVDVSKDAAENQRARRTLLEPILQQYIDMGAQVHTIGLSHQADERTLKAMAHLTDGLFEVAEDADQLLDIFLRALDNTVITQQVPVQIDEQTFEVHANLESMTIVVEKNGDHHIKLRDGNQRLFGKHQTLASQQWQSSSTHDVISVQQPVAGTWALVSPTAKLKRVNVVGQLQILLQQSHQNIKVGQRAYLDVQLANEKGVLLSENQLQGFELGVEVMLDGQQISSQAQVFLAHKKTRVHLPVIDQAGMYDVNISVVKGQLVREISRNLRVHPLVAVALSVELNPSNTAPAQDIAVTEQQPTAISQESMMISKEQASPALQALMQAQGSVATPTASVATVAITNEPQPSAEVVFEPKVEASPEAQVSPEVETITEVEAQPLTATERIAKLVDKVKGQSSSVEAPTPSPSATVETPQEELVVTAKTAVDSDDLSYSRWLVVIGAGLLLLVLLLFLRRSGRSAT
ncbi:MAG TPA: hypothetical protein DE045_03880 [Oceanospirillaceae bacterium]|nr:hypothetical protein [Oceanospirillaceae bacterium]